MSHGSGHNVDSTGEAAVGDVAGSAVFEQILRRVERDEDRVMLLAHIGLGTPPRDLARGFGISVVQVTERIAEIVAGLRSDPELIAKLGDIRRAGRPDNYPALAFKLGLQQYFCLSCERFMAPSDTGAIRKTCSHRCRTNLYRARQQYRQPASSTVKPERWTPPEDEFVRILVKPIDRGVRNYRGMTTHWEKEDVCLRDRAIVLLALTCPLTLTPNDLAALDVADAPILAKAVELRLHDRDGRRYVRVPARKDAKACPVKALEAWRLRVDCRSGPLFLRMNRNGRPGADPTRIHALTIARIVTALQINAVGLFQDAAKPSTSIPGYLL